MPSGREDLLSLLRAPKAKKNSTVFSLTPYMKTNCTHLPLVWKTKPETAQKGELERKPVWGNPGQPADYSWGYGVLLPLQADGSSLQDYSENLEGTHSSLEENITMLVSLLHD